MFFMIFGFLFHLIFFTYFLLWRFISVGFLFTFFSLFYFYFLFCLLACVRAACSMRVFRGCVICLFYFFLAFPNLVNRSASLILSMLLFNV